MPFLTRRALLSQLLFTAPPAVEDAGQAHARLRLPARRRGHDEPLVPYADDAYYRARPTIGIKAPANGSDDKSRAMRLDDHYALHPALQPLQAQFDEGRLGIVQAVGYGQQHRLAL